MRFIYGKIDWKDEERAEENCFLLTNGLGGFSSQSMIGSNARNDQALLMACLKAPVDRYHLVTRLEEELRWKSLPDGGKVSLSGQRYVDYTKNACGQHYLQSFAVDDFPVWIYQARGVQIRKTMVMKHGENTTGVRYEIDNRGREAVELCLTPMLQFMEKSAVMSENKKFTVSAFRRENEDLPQTCGDICSEGITLHYFADADVEVFETQYITDLYYAHDSRDGRNAVGRAACNHRMWLEIPPKSRRRCDVVYSVEHDFCRAGGAAEAYTVDAMQHEERARLKELTERAGLKDAVAMQLVKSADRFVVDRQSTGGKSIIAGYPFFGDWGRDTMIALTGCCISTKRFADAANIFDTFRRYCRRGIMPNMFPEGDTEPMYNTADASLLFIGAVYEYYMVSGDLELVRDNWSTMQEIISFYENGTDFHIFMDEDGLISAGGGLEQVTWMDVRYQDILPTPRHGKPVEINAYWYNDLCLMAELALIFGEDDSHYRTLAQRVQKSFCEKFWNEEAGCLKDVLTAEETELSGPERERRKRAENQIRCNQIWAVSQRFTMLPPEKERAVVDCVFEKLYTPRGLRSLAAGDPEFCPRYTGALKNRDLSYHQGTVWGFPLGGYFLAYLKVNGFGREAKAEVREQLAGIEGALREGAIGQLAEVYDGDNPVVSEGCFAQGWSTAELLRVYAAIEDRADALPPPRAFARMSES